MKKTALILLCGASLAGCATYETNSVRERYIVDSSVGVSTGIVVIDRYPGPDVIYGYPPYYYPHHPYPTYPYPPSYPCRGNDWRCNPPPKPQPKPSFDPRKLPNNPGYYKRDPSDLRTPRSPSINTPNLNSPDRTPPRPLPSREIRENRDNVFKKD